MDNIILIQPSSRGDWYAPATQSDRRLLLDVAGLYQVYPDQLSAACRDAAAFGFRLEIINMADNSAAA